MKQFILNKINSAIQSLSMSTNCVGTCSKFSVIEGGRNSEYVSHQSTEFSPPMFPCDGETIVLHNTQHLLLFCATPIETNGLSDLLKDVSETSPEWNRYISTLEGGLLPVQKLGKKILELLEEFPHSDHPDFYYVYTPISTLQDWDEDGKPVFTEKHEEFPMFGDMFTWDHDTDMVSYKGENGTFKGIYDLDVEVVQKINWKEYIVRCDNLPDEPVLFKTTSPEWGKYKKFLIFMSKEGKFSLPTWMFG